MQLITETITVKYSDEPKGAGPWKIKDATGRQFSGWPKRLTRPEPGSTIVIHYETGEYMGKPQYTIQKIGGDAPAAPASSPYHAGHAPIATSPSPYYDKPKPNGESRMIFITGVVGRAMGSGNFGATDIEVLALAAAAAFDKVSNT